MAQTPVMVNTICTWRVRQGTESSTNRMFRPLVTPVYAFTDPVRLLSSMSADGEIMGPVLTRIKTRISTPPEHRGAAGKQQATLLLVVP